MESNLTSMTYPVQIQVIARTWFGLLLTSSWFSPPGRVTKVIVDKGHAGLIQHVTFVFPDNVNQTMQRSTLHNHITTVGRDRLGSLQCKNP